MRRILLLCLLVGFACLIPLGGCSLGLTPEERAHRHVTIADHDMRALVEDIDTVLMLDRSGRLTFWRSR